MKSIFEQHLSLEIPQNALYASERSFNGSVMDWHGKRLMAYRCHAKGEKLCSIHLANLRVENEGILEGCRVKVPKIHENGNLEDPRLFKAQGSLWVAWTEAHYSGNNWFCIQRYGKLNSDFDVEEAFTPDFGQNNYKAKEKNWQFFDYNGKIHAIYSHRPQVVIELQGETVVNSYTTYGVSWHHGQASGGTPPIAFNEESLLTLFHAYVPNSDNHRIYNVGALLINRHPPFEITHCSSEPIIHGSDKEPFPTAETWNPICIFPGGVVRDGGDWIVSTGVNDCRIYLSWLNSNSLKLERVKKENRGAFALIRVLKNTVVDGFLRKAGDKAEAKRSTAENLVKTGQAEIIPEPEYTETVKAA